MPAAKQPPFYPTDLTEMLRAMNMLKRFQKGQFVDEKLLILMVGRMPASKDEAHRWRLWIRKLRRDVMKEEEEC